MSEFYQNLNKIQIENIIKQKLIIYDDDLPRVKFHHIPLKKTDFQFQHYVRYNKLDPKTCKMFKYGACHSGISLYEFYNVVIQQEDDRLTALKNNPLFAMIKDSWDKHGLKEQVGIQFDPEDDYFVCWFGNDEEINMNEEEKQEAYKYCMELMGYVLNNDNITEKEAKNKRKNDDSHQLRGLKSNPISVKKTKK